MAVRSRRIFGPITATAGGITQLYEVPAGRTAVVRCLAIATPTGTAGLVVLRLNATVGNAVWANNAFVPGAFILQDFVFNPGDILHVQTGAGVVASVSGYGALLLGSPA